MAQNRRINVSLFGPPRIDVDGQPISLGWRKATALPAYLCVADGQVSRETLASLFWPESREARAFGNLRNAISTLRRVLGTDFFSVSRSLVSLANRDSWCVDTMSFRDRIHLVKAEQAALPMEEREQHLLKAVDLYRGEFLAGFTLPDCLIFDEWQRFECDHFWSDYSWSLEQLTSLCAGARRYDRAADFAVKQLEINPLEEAVHRRLMCLRIWAGQRGRALRDYERCVALLRREIDAEPEHETTELFEAIRRNAEIPAPPAKQIVTGRQINLRQPQGLPVAATVLIGRDTELEAARQRLLRRDVRLLSLTGAGGSGNYVKFLLM